MEQKKFIQDMKSQDKASSSHVHRKLQEFPFVKKLNTGKHRSLKENTLTAINYNKTLEITSKLKNIDKKDIDAVQTFIKTMLDSLTSRSKKFANVITTDGYAVSFMFKKTVSIQDEPKREPKTPKDFADIIDDAEIWAVDPGISTIFTAVDSTEHERIRIISLEEYYHLCGYNLATRRRKEHQECHLDEFKYIGELPTLKTANLTSFLLAASTRLQNYQRIHNYYCQVR
ncbi:hypothetical protein G6F70_000727 [Rhizopus microsporus]|nr:hypothetical protein G6F71_004470 [Rhizopus microsporus]KAG1204156.1 hypothetical protein G6F70_000727 [Rhizopus microsporus]KAG1209333.1 hypothetical protein G6F69_006453 [Rhizopus microsporus]KAG1230733.1 hypothetical protein G6F67_006253 [Rhizopus microsporus]KAG1263707.1 hypothetical protein G6F68_004935 [Rhizopus microsporus]